MQKPTTTNREWKQLRDQQAKRVVPRNAYGYHFHEFVVVRINQFKAGAPLRTIVIPTGGVSSKAQDSARCQRLFRRLRKWAGFRATTDFPRGRECDGIFGTMFGYTS